MIFTILGNQENLKGNPIPYHRTTRGARFSKEHRRYEAWKSNVLSCSSRKAKFDLSERYCKVEMDIEWKDEGHADGDNVVSAIVDRVDI